MTKLTKQEAEGWLTRMIENSTGDCYALDMTKYTLSLLKAIPEPEPEWGPWIGWNGGELSETGVVQAAFSDGKIGKYAAEDLADFTEKMIAFRVKKAPPEPEIWFRVKGGTPQLFQSKRDLEIDHSWLADEFIEKVEVRVVK